MEFNRKVVATAAAVTAIAAGGVGIAYGVGGDSDEQVTGPDADKAKAAALDAVDGGKVTEIEHQDGDGAGSFEVEIQRPDGSELEVYVDDQYRTVGQEQDDDTGSEDESGAEDESGE
jgi:hypothetical protein